MSDYVLSREQRDKMYKELEIKRVAYLKTLRVLEFPVPLVKSVESFEISCALDHWMSSICCDEQALERDQDGDDS
jgi:hypothetical protein